MISFWATTCCLEILAVLRDTWISLNLVVDCWHLDDHFYKEEILFRQFWTDFMLSNFIAVFTPTARHDRLRVIIIDTIFISQYLTSKLICYAENLMTQFDLRAHKLIIRLTRRVLLSWLLFMVWHNLTRPNFIQVYDTLTMPHIRRLI